MSNISIYVDAMSKQVEEKIADSNELEKKVKNWFSQSRQCPLSSAKSINTNVYAQDDARPREQNTDDNTIRNELVPYLSYP